MYPEELKNWRIRAAFDGVTLSDWIREKCSVPEPGIGGIRVKTYQEIEAAKPPEPEQPAIEVKQETVKPETAKPKTCRHGHRLGFRCSQCKGEVAA